MAYSQTFSYDNYGNMSCSASPAETKCLQTTYANNNQISYVTVNGVNTNYTYGAAGDLTADGTGLAQSGALRVTGDQTRRSMLSRDESLR